MRKTLGPTKYPREKVLDQRNNHEKKLWTHEIPTRKNLIPTKYPRENILDPRNTHEKNFRTHEGTIARWHVTHDGTRPTEFSTPLKKDTFLKKYHSVSNFREASD